MPMFFFHYNDGWQTVPGELGLEFASLEQAYLEACAAIPGIARDLLIKKRDPLAASITIANAEGRDLMTIPFTEALSPSEWRLTKARRRPHGGPRSASARNDLALANFRQMFSSVNAGCVLLTSEMEVVEMNAFGARHSHVDADAIRGMSIFDVFHHLRGEAKANFDNFMSLARSGVISEVVDLPYLGKCSTRLGSRPVIDGSVAGAVWS